MTPISVLSIASGAALIAWTFVDVLQTVLVIGGGAGVQSRRVGDRSWRLALRLHDPSSARSHSLMRAVGPAIVLGVLAAWVLELTLGCVDGEPAFDAADGGLPDEAWMDAYVRYDGWS